MKNLVTFCFILTFLFNLNSLSGNNIQITNVSLEGQVYTDQYVFVEFDISWENSWRTSNIPLNYDAAWLFVKYRLANQEWHHMLLRQTDYFAPTSSIVTVSPDSVGAMIYRDADGSGTVSWENVRLRWDYGEAGIADDALVEVRVYGIEMVYIPQGAFYVGDGAANDRFHQGGDQDEPFLIGSNGSIVLANNNATELFATGNIYSGNLPTAFPKGYDAFYCMKYELSQEQYVEFLNTLDRTQQNTRTETDISSTSITNVFVMSETSTLSYRCGISCDATVHVSDPVNFYCNYNNTSGGHNDYDDGQNIACNWLSWMDAAAYLDWSGLRPITELEYEKACRGPNPAVAGEFAWGTSLITTWPGGMSNEGEAAEILGLTEDNTGQCAYLGGYDFGGPLRCGIFAGSSFTHTRVHAGSGYYGNMELSGNLWELIVNIYHTAGWSYDGKHGNGMLNSTGDADVDHWPGINGNTTESVANTIYEGTTGVTGWAGAGIRGGNFGSSAWHCHVSDRLNAYTAVSPWGRHPGFSGRGCRTAP